MLGKYSTSAWASNPTLFPCYPVGLNTSLSNCKSYLPVAPSDSYVSSPEHWISSQNVIFTTAANQGRRVPDKGIPFTFFVNNPDCLLFLKMAYAKLKFKINFLVATQWFLAWRSPSNVQTLHECLHLNYLVTAKVKNTAGSKTAPTCILN